MAGASVGAAVAGASVGAAGGWVAAGAMVAAGAPQELRTNIKIKVNMIRRIIRTRFRM